MYEGFLPQKSVPLYFSGTITSSKSLSNDISEQILGSVNPSNDTFDTLLFWNELS